MLQSLIVALEVLITRWKQAALTGPILPESTMMVTIEERDTLQSLIVTPEVLIPGGSRLY